MSFTSAPADLLYSTLAHDAEMAELVDLFVKELPARLDALQRAAMSGDLREAARLAHQLKGAGGSHGFPQITAAAAAVERAAAPDTVDSLLTALEQFRDVCCRVR